ncbi:hypothetical protein P7K49_037021 [Saguinus oedipus]|uniref:Uncharacterized protein n=1 Tax=Saguinus oedipus TaxID=9490 RepID=A0ABQ9TLV9_SAGOE|nr:hypothetical protein P7K49_037021 [Saguinus oedipus]
MPVGSVLRSSGCHSDGHVAQQVLTLNPGSGLPWAPHTSLSQLSPEASRLPMDSAVVSTSTRLLPKEGWCLTLMASGLSMMRFLCVSGTQREVLSCALHGRMAVGQQRLLMEHSPGDVASAQAQPKGRAEMGLSVHPRGMRPSPWTSCPTTGHEAFDLDFLSTHRA